MHSYFKKCASLIALVSTIAVHANTVSPTLAYRSQGFHGDRQRNVGMVDKINLYDMESWYGTLDMGVGYMRSFRPERIAHCLFGDDLVCGDCKNTILVQGSEVANRNAKAWLADYFYLNCEYDGSFSVNPIIKNVVVDLDFYLGLDEWVNGMYFRVYGPITWTKWDTRFCCNDPETVLTSSCSTGYFTSNDNTGLLATGSNGMNKAEVLLNSLCDFFSGCEAPDSVDGITFQPLKFAKMSSCNGRTHAGFADLRAELGWNFLLEEDYHLGAGLHVAAPTGNHRTAEYVMAPVVGNGNHWELGGTVHGNYVFWRNEDETSHFGLSVDAVITHMFKAHEQRTFDLLGKDNSRYMLASKFTKNVSTLTRARKTAGTAVAGSTAILAQFDNEYAPVANLTTTDVKVSVGVQADITAMLNYTRGGFSWDLGYNFWARSCEDIDCILDCDPCNPDSIFLSANKDTWALKGDARMFGFNGSMPMSVVSERLNESQALSASQNSADIHSGTNAGFIDATLTDVKKQNGGVDNAQFAIIQDGLFTGIRLIHTPTTQGGINDNSNQIKTSIQPIFISRNDVALQETKGLSHKIFTHLSYTLDRDDWVPFIGIGASAEFGRTEGCDDECDKTSCSDVCGNCIYCSLSQWSVWVKGGVSFN